MTRYTNYETNLTFNKEEWENYYNEHIDHSEYPTFFDWWFDMTKMNLLAEV